jgi:hypothetical protein
MTQHFVESRWKPIPSCPGYGASDYGRIRNDGRGTLLIGTDDRYGYRCVNIMVDGKRVKRKVHRLVCEAWHGPCPDGHECGHLDGNSSNNRADNLAWITRSENIRHQMQHGTFASANLNRQRLSDDTVSAIRADAADGMGGRRLAKKYGIDRGHAYRLVTHQRRPKADAQPSSSRDSNGDSNPLEANQ